MKKVKYMVLALVLCLGLIGGAYAAWTDQTVVTTEINTGKLDTVFSNDPEQTSVSAEFDEGDYPWGGGSIEVATTNAEVVVDSEGNYTVLEITIDTAYPGYWSEVTSIVVNNGTIPVKLNDIDFNSPDAVDVEIKVLELGDQVEPNGGTAEIVVRSEITSLAEEDRTVENSNAYTYTVELEFIQWNY